MRPGSAFEIDWGGSGLDVVLLTNFLHHFDQPTCEQVAASHAALARATAITLEHRMPTASRRRRQPPSRHARDHGNCSEAPAPFAEYEQIFVHAGFRRNEFHALPPTTQQAVVSYKE